MESIISQIIHLFKLEDRLDIREIRLFLNSYFWPILAVLGTIFGFLMGIHTSFLQANPVITLEQFEPIYKKEYESMKESSVSTSTIVASKNGTKYYFVWCKGSNNIKKENKVFFDTEEKAQRAGYQLSGTCK